MKKQEITEKYEKLIQKEQNLLNETIKEIKELKEKIMAEYYENNNIKRSICLYDYSQNNRYYYPEIPFDKLNPISQRYKIDTDRESLLSRRIKRINAKIKKIKRDMAVELAGNICYDAIGNELKVGDIILFSDGHFGVMKICEHKDTTRFKLVSYMTLNKNISPLKSTSILKNNSWYNNILKLDEKSLKVLQREISAVELNKIVDNF